jgi:Domain of unknown function (DUF1854)
MQRELDNSHHGDPRAFRLHLDALGRLVLTEADGRQFEDVEPIRAFPISAPHAGISICDCEGHELHWIDSTADLADDARHLLEAELRRREFMPHIRRIIRMDAIAEPSEWDVETDRGRTSFLLGSEEDVHRVDAQQAMIVDTNGIRYLIPNVRSLDAHSRRILERFL